MTAHVVAKRGRGTILPASSRLPVGDVYSDVLRAVSFCPKLLGLDNVYIVACRRDNRDDLVFGHCVGFATPVGLSPDRLASV